MCGFFHIIWWHFARFNFCSLLLDPTFFFPRKYSTNGIPFSILTLGSDSSPSAFICAAAALLCRDVSLGQIQASLIERKRTAVFGCWGEKQSQGTRDQPMRVWREALELQLEVNGEGSRERWSSSGCPFLTSPPKSRWKAAFKWEGVKNTIETKIGLSSPFF